MTPLALLILFAGGPAPSIQVIGRFATAQACPISRETALTCAHVVDLRPFDPLVQLYPLLWSDGEASGIAKPLATLAACDLALLQGEFPRWFELATEPPAIGSRVRFQGYSWRNRGRAYEPREFEAKVLRVVAGHVVMDRPGEPGSSGSCVLDEQNRVVAVNCSGHTMDSGEEVARAVGTWMGVVKELLEFGH